MTRKSSFTMLYQYLTQTAQEVEVQYLQSISKSINAFKRFFSLNQREQVDDDRSIIVKPFFELKRQLEVKSNKDYSYVNQYKYPQNQGLRLLSSVKNCRNNGIAYISDKEAFYCNQTRVKKSEFLRLNSTQTCQRRTIQQADMCICPRDFHGQNCQHRTPLYCTPELTYPKATSCKGETSDFYDWSIPGDDPCIFAQSRQDLRFRAVCTSPFWAIQGIDTEDWFDVVTPPKPSDMKFNYVVNKTDLVISQIPNNMKIKLGKFNFANLRQTTTDILIDRVSQLLGEQELAYSLDLNTQKEMNHFAGGRLYYEAYFNSQDKDYVFTEITPGFIDLIGYDPGTKNYNQLTGGEIAGIVIGALFGVVIVVLIIVCVIIKIKRKRNSVQDKVHTD